MSSAIFFNLDQPEILSSGNGLTKQNMKICKLQHALSLVWVQSSNIRPSVHTIYIQLFRITWIGA